MSDQSHFFDAFLLTTAQQHVYAPDEVLFYEGDALAELMQIERGTVALSYGTAARGTAGPGDLLDPIATLGGLPHRLKAQALDEVVVKTWPLDDLWAHAGFQAAARRYLATQLEQAEARRRELEAPLHYLNDRADLVPGPFRFDDVTLIFAFCDAERAVLEALLPEPLSLLLRPGRKTGTVLLALADFPTAYSENRPDARFGYTETTVFVPIRHRRAFGLYVPYIYPSTWEPTLLGREIYGFPKRLGNTRFESKSVSVTVDGDALCRFTWGNGEAVSEARLVGALGEALGVMGQVTALAFQAGEVLRKVARLPAHRRVDVYNRRRLLSPGATADEIEYEMDHLTRASFGVLRWHQIARLHDTELWVQGEPLAKMGLTLRDAYRTQLDMRLSAGRVVKGTV